MNEQSIIFKAIKQCEDLKRQIEEACGDDELREHLLAIYEKNRRRYTNILKAFENELSKLEIREHVILRMYCLECMSAESIGLRVYLSPRQVRRIIEGCVKNFTDPRAIRIYNERKGYTEIYDR